MQTPPQPPDEAQRLRELYSYDVLDTETEKALDDLVQSAAALCGTTFGALTMLDKNRQWFKAQTGFSLKETVRSQSVCGHGILTRAFFEVPDTQSDDRFHDNPLLKALGVRFYGGTQLIGQQGHVLGMLCVLDPQPQQLSASQKAQLETLAMRAMALLDAHRQRRRMEWLGTVVSQVQDEIYLFDLQTQQFLHANEAAMRHDRAGEAELLMEEVTPDTSPSELAEHIRRLQAGTAEVAYETTVLRAGVRVPVEARWQALKTTDQALVMCTLRELSQRRRLELS